MEREEKTPLFQLKMFSSGILSIRDSQTHARHWNKTQINERNTSGLRSYKMAVVGKNKGIRRIKKNTPAKRMHLGATNKGLLGILSAKSGTTHKRNQGENSQSAGIL